MSTLATIADLSNDTADLDATVDGLVTLATLETVLADIKSLLLSRGWKLCGNLTALATVSGTEASNCIVAGEGIYTYDTSAGTGAVSASGGGFWNKSSLGVQLADLADMVITSPTDAEVLRYNSSSGKWENGAQAVTSVGWGNVTAKPFTNDGTDPTTSGVTKANGGIAVNGTYFLVSSTGDVAVNTNKYTIAGASGNVVGAGTMTIAGAVTFSSTLSVAGNIAINTNKFTIAASTGNTAIAGTLNVTGDTTLTNLIITGNTTLGDVNTDTVVAAGTVQAQNVDTSGVQTGYVNISAGPGMPTYTDNADAISNGALVGDLYQSGDFLKRVH